MTKKGKKRDKKSQVSQSEPETTEINVTEANQVSDPKPTDVFDYDESLRRVMNPWRALASESRQQGYKSAADLLRRATGDAETKAALESIKSKAIALGTELSRLIVDYIFAFWRFDSKEKSAKTRSIANTIRRLRLEDDGRPNAVVDGLIASIELVEDQIEFPTLHYNDDGGPKGDHQVVENESEALALRMICFRVLSLEIVLYFPGLIADDKVSIQRIGDYVAKGDCLERHLETLETTVRVFKELSLQNVGRVGKEKGLENVEETEILKNCICLEIEKIWSQLRVF